MMFDDGSLEDDQIGKKVDACRKLKGWTKY